MTSLFLRVRCSESRRSMTVVLGAAMLVLGLSGCSSGRTTAQPSADRPTSPSQVVAPATTSSDLVSPAPSLSPSGLSPSGLSPSGLSPSGLSPSGLAMPSPTASPSPSPSPVPKPKPTPKPTPTPTPVVLPPPVPGSLSGKVIVLDPGHNLNNSSAINKQIYAGNGVYKACDTVGTSTNDGYPEHAFTWDVAGRTAAILRHEGATVILTRPSDSGIGPCVPERAQIGNDAHADAFIAIHADGGPSTGHGFFVMQPPPDNPNVNPGGAPRSRVLAKTMHDVFHAVTGISYSSYIANGYYPDSTTTGTINLSHGPVITIECLDMRNSGDAALARDPNGRQRIAAGIAAGLTAFLTQK